MNRRKTFMMPFLSITADSCPNRRGRIRRFLPKTLCLQNLIQPVGLHRHRFCGAVQNTRANTSRTSYQQPCQMYIHRFSNYSLHFS
jgi:hypothetical protein